MPRVKAVLAVVARGGPVGLPEDRLAPVRLVARADPEERLADRVARAAALPAGRAAALRVAAAMEE